MEISIRRGRPAGLHGGLPPYAHRDIAAARRFFERAIDQHDVPEKITLDKSGANTAAVQGLIDNSGASIELRQSKYLNNIRTIEPSSGGSGRCSGSSRSGRRPR